MRGRENPLLFLPIEIKVREFHGKLLFSLFVAENGFDVLLAGQNELMRRLGRLDRGIYLDKSVTVSKEQWFRRCRLLGNRVAAWDEEGLVFRSAEIYRANRCCREALEQVDVLFAWGQVQADAVLGALPSMAGRIDLTGNPRFDLLRPEFRRFYEPQIDAVRAKHGRLVLLNTNFGFYNHFRGRDEVREMIAQYPGARDKDYVEGWFAFQKQGFEAFAVVMERVSRAFPDHAVIVRPSPSEDGETWRALAEPHSNVTVTNEGNAVEWILASDAVVHFNCTTGVEAFLLDVPSIAFRPEPSETYESHLPNAVSLNASSADEVVEQLTEVMRRDETGSAPVQTAERMAVAERYITAMDGPFASQRIAERLGELAHGLGRRRSAMERLGQLRREALPAVLRPFERRPRDEVLYERQKFGGLTLEEVHAAINRFRDISGRFGAVRARPAGKHSLLICGED